MYQYIFETGLENEIFWPKINKVQNTKEKES